MRNCKRIIFWRAVYQAKVVLPPAKNIYYMQSSPTKILCASYVVLFTPISLIYSSIIFDCRLSGSLIAFTYPMHSYSVRESWRREIGLTDNNIPTCHILIYIRCPIMFMHRVYSLPVGHQLVHTHIRPCPEWGGTVSLLAPQVQKGNRGSTTWLNHRCIDQRKINYMQLEHYKTQTR